MTIQDEPIEKRKDAINACDADVTAKVVGGGKDNMRELRSAGGAAWGDLKTGFGVAWQSLSSSVGRAAKRFR